MCKTILRILPEKSVLGVSTSMLRIFGRATIQGIKRMSSSSSSPVIIRSSEITGPIEESIIEKVTTALSPTFLKVANDSHKHSHHQAMQTASNVKESHFRLEIVSDSFVGKNMPARHRIIYQLLDDEFKTKGLHALQMKTKTVEEAAKQANK